MNLNKKYILYIVLTISVIGNIFTLWLDIIPATYPKVKDRYFKKKTLQRVDSLTSNIVLEATLSMARSSKVSMVWHEYQGMTHAILSLNSTRHSVEFERYNFPRAFLLWSLSNYLTNQKVNNIQYLEFKNLFDDFVNKDGNPTFSLNRIDQIPFGLVALNLYKESEEKKYLTFSHNIYNYLEKQIGSDSIVSYRPNQELVFLDMLGMVIPFLIDYAKVTGKDRPLEIAKRQLEYYIKHGVDKETFLPTHAINRKNLIKVGSANWGRGIGWYYIALSYFYKETGLFKDEYFGLTETLLSLKNSEGLWSQFPGSSEKFDASSTTMFYWGIILNNVKNYNTVEIIKSLQNYISVSGVILQTSGDTYGTNRYSNTFGESELSQGILLLILSSLEE